MKQDDANDTAASGVRDRLIGATLQVLTEYGPPEVKARTVAARAGLSTMVVYTCFGGMPELMAAVIDDGFARLARGFGAVPVSADPVTDLFAMALVSRHLAWANPHRYDLMFGLSTRQSRRVTSSDSSAVPTGRSPAFQAAYTHLVASCERLVASNRIRPQDPAVIAAQLWSFVHGFISLELAEHFADFADSVAEVLAPMGITFMVGLGDDLPRATASTLAAQPVLERAATAPDP
jgi:AcrR family transcriptional regulator